MKALNMTPSRARPWKGAYHASDDFVTRARLRKGGPPVPTEEAHHARVPETSPQVLSPTLGRSRRRRPRRARRLLEREPCPRRQREDRDGDPRLRRPRAKRHEDAPGAGRRVHGRERHLPPQPLRRTQAGRREGPVVLRLPEGTRLE